MNNMKYYPPLKPTEDIKEMLNKICETQQDYETREFIYYLDPEKIANILLNYKQRIENIEIKLKNETYDL